VTFGAKVVVEGEAVVRTNGKASVADGAVLSGRVEL
jgi:hypothetical protein